MGGVPRGREVRHHSKIGQDPFQRWRHNCDTVSLNVGGKVFYVTWNLMAQVNEGDILSSMT